MLPSDPNEKAALRRSYRRGERAAWVSIALFTRQDDPNRRASINRIYPEERTSRIDRIALPITLDGRPDGSVSVPAMVGQKEQHRLVVVYWYQLGHRAYGNVYAYRLALMREILFNRQADAALVRIAIPLQATEPVDGSLRLVSEIAPPLYAATTHALAQWR